MIEVGQLVKWIPSGESEAVTGTCVKTGLRIALQDGGITHEAPASDGTWTKVGVGTPALAVAAKLARMSSSAGGSGTRLEQCRALYDALKSRKENIQVFVDTLGMTIGGASTYYNVIRNRVLS